MMKSVIEINGLSKRYLINHINKKKVNSLRELISSKFSKKIIINDFDKEDQKDSVEDFWALKDVTFQVKEGERIAVIGGNGAGKSTLLKILSRITEPTEGSVKIKGKVASLLEVGTGFHPELSGRENIYLNGAILGMSRREIQSKFDTIVNFSGVEKFLDTPVKHYSSGMYVRLAFSVSAWLDPDILIVDEVLSVGDQAFQKRCADRMKELTGDGKTVIFVSHSMAAVKSMCEKALFLKNGEIVSFTAVEDAAIEYMRSVDEDAGCKVWHKRECLPCDSDIVRHVDCHDFAVFLGGIVLDSTNTPSDHLEIEKPFQIQLRYEILKELPYITVPNFHFYDESGNRFFITFPELPIPRGKGIYTVTCDVNPFIFNVGRFNVMLALSSYELNEPLHFAIENAMRFEIVENIGVDNRRHGWAKPLPGVSRPRLNWNVKLSS